MKVFLRDLGRNDCGHGNVFMFIRVMLCHIHQFTSLLSL